MRPGGSLHTVSVYKHTVTVTSTARENHQAARENHQAARENHQAVMILPDGKRKPFAGDDTA